MNRAGNGAQLYAIAFVAVNLTGGIAIWFSADQNPFASALLSASALMLTCLYARLFAGRDFDAMTFFSLLYLLYALVLPGLYQVRNERYFWASRAAGEDYAVQAAAIMFFSICAFSVACAVFPSRRSAPHSGPGKPPGQWLPGTAPLLAAGISLGQSLMALKTLGPVAFFAPREAASIYYRLQGINLSQLGLTKTLSQGFAIAALCLALLAFFRFGRRDIWTWLAVICAIASNLIANFPLAIARFYLVAMLFTIGTTAALGWMRRNRLHLYFWAPILMFVVFPTLGKFNRYKEIDFSFVDMSLTEYLSHGDLDGFQSIMNAVLLVREQGLAWGGQLISALLFFVPRSIWAGKGEPTGAVAAENAGYSFLNISMPLPGELYVDGGLILAILGMAGLGILIRRLDRAISAHSGAATLMTPLAILLAGFSPILLRGSLLGTIAAFMAGCFLIVVATMITRALRSLLRRPALSGTALQKR